VCVCQFVSVCLCVFVCVCVLVEEKGAFLLLFLVVGVGDMSEAENGNLEELESMQRELSRVRGELNSERSRRKKAEELVDRLKESAAKSVRAGPRRGSP